VDPGDPDRSGCGEKDEDERDQAEARKHQRFLQERTTQDAARLAARI
jgi:hypothetical protein